ncbi:MAG TPA: hypothetical protein VFQ80_07075, partial [Thermomicrobiales bacterium]|nr:hypothetical protein [Thermomicrobiales bacterium]
PAQRIVAGPGGRRWQDAPAGIGSIVLRPGEALLVPPDVPLAIHPADDAPAALLQLGGLPLAPDAAARPGTSQSGASVFASGAGLLQLAEGATLEPLAESALPAGRGPEAAMAVSVTRAALPPGAALAPHSVAGAQLVGVEAGLLGVAAPAAGDDGPDPGGEDLILDGLPLASGTAPRLRNAGGTRLDLVVVTLTPILPRASEKTWPRYPSHAR